MVSHRVEAMLALDSRLQPPTYHMRNFQASDLEEL